MYEAADQRKLPERRGPYTHTGGRDFRCGRQGDTSGAYTAEDAALIVNLHNAFPALVTRIEALEHIYQLAKEVDACFSRRAPMVLSESGIVAEKRLEAFRAALDDYEQDRVEEVLRERSGSDDS